MSNPQIQKQQQPSSPVRFVKPADLFMIRRKSLVPTSSSPYPMIEPQSPLKCLNKITEPSPTKGLPTLLKNPFNKPVKRRLQLGFSPSKNQLHSTTPSKNLSPANKRNRMLDVDEDANLEAPKFRILKSPTKRLKNNNVTDDWIIVTDLGFNLELRCKNWLTATRNFNRRLRPYVPSIESPFKKNNTHSLSSTKISVYQHPYFAWQSLYPRMANEFDNIVKHDNPFNSVHQSHISKMLFKDWSESFDNLFQLLLDGMCPYFYLCADLFNILLEHNSSLAEEGKHKVHAYISPISYGIKCKMESAGIELKILDFSKTNLPYQSPMKAHYNTSINNTITNNINNNNSQDESSQHSFGSQTQSSCNNNSGQGQSIRVPSSIDSGNVSCEGDDESFDYDDIFDENSNQPGEDENEESSQYLSKLGWSPRSVKFFYKQQDKGFKEGDSNTQTKITKSKPLAYLDGEENLKKLANFLKTNEKFTIHNVGKFACIPPTLLSPCEFRLSTFVRSGAELKRLFEN